jgi:hypothetical protein
MRAKSSGAHLLVEGVAVLALVTSALGVLAGDVEGGTSETSWVYDAEVLISSITLTGDLRIVEAGAPGGYAGHTGSDLQAYRWDGSFSISGFYNGALASGSANYSGVQTVHLSTGRVLSSEMNMSFDLTTCEGMGDEADHILWNHVTTESLPTEEGEYWPDTYTAGETWTETYTVHSVVDGRYYDDELVSYERVENMSTTYLVLDSETMRVGEEDYSCGVVLSENEEGIILEWMNASFSLPVKVTVERYHVPVYHSGEDWTITLVSWTGSCGCTGVESLYVGTGVGAAIGCAAVALFGRSPVRRGA